ncbi:MAG: helix-turn-helix transcriptional regulator [Bacilli bacterium]|nr:helix-turn-helix transcriptional regulator [Bacilli bacterium]
MENKLGVVISKLRKEKGLTQKDLADKLNISDKAVSRWETGGSSPNMEMLLRISQFFNVPLNDLITARVSSDDKDDNLVKEIIQEFSEMNKRNSKRIRTVILATIIIVVILTIAIIFTNSYNRFKVYNVNLESEEIYSVTGIYVETKIKDSLYLDSLKIRNYEYSETDTISVDLYFLKDGTEHILQSYSSLNKIRFINYQSYIKIDDLSNYFDNLYLRVTIIDEKNNQTSYTGRLIFVMDFSNNKIFHNEDEFNSQMYRSTTILSEKEIKNILLDNGFEETNDDVLTKRTKNYSMSYFAATNKFNYNFEKNNLNYRMVYQLNNGILNVIIFDENSTEIESYFYDTINEKVINCNTGSCKSYKYAMKVLNENVLNLLYQE